MEKAVKDGAGSTRDETAPLTRKPGFYWQFIPHVICLMLMDEHVLVPSGELVMRTTHVHIGYMCVQGIVFISRP